MSEHAVLPPSSAKEWSNCHGWLQMNEGIEDVETDDARWGTECHVWASEALEQIRHNREPELPPDAEQRETVEAYLEHCRALMIRTGAFASPNLGIETRVYSRDLPDHVWGTEDFYAYDPSKRTLYIRDFKAGHLIVDPDDPQLLLYAHGTLEALGLDDQTTVVDVGVVQPRGYCREGPIRNVRMWAYELRPRINQIMMAAEANLKGGGQVMAGAHCRDCKARYRCPAAINAVYSVAEAVPAEPTPAELGLLLRHVGRALKHLTQMQKAFEGQAEGLIKSGQVVPGFAVTPSYARSEDWTQDRDAVLLLGQLYGVDLNKPGLDTPAQARKKGIPAEIISGYCTRRKTGVKLTESNPDEVIRIFGDKQP